MFDLSMQELTQVCIGSNDVGLHFYRATNSSAKRARGASVHMGAGFDLARMEYRLRRQPGMASALRRVY